MQVGCHSGDACRLAARRARKRAEPGAQQAAVLAELRRDAHRPHDLRRVALPAELRFGHDPVVRAVRWLGGAALAVAVVLSLVGGVLLSRQATLADGGLCGSAADWVDPRNEIRGGDVSLEESERIGAECQASASLLVGEAMPWVQVGGIATVVAGVLLGAAAVAGRRSRR